jgi:predicted dehydrogenase
VTDSTLPLNVAVVGVGYWGPNLVRNLHALDDASPALVCDHHPERLATIEDRYPGLPTTMDYARVLDDPAIDAIVIATQVGTHAELATAALEAGKHVLVEKPLAASVTEAESLIELADRRGVTLMTGHTFLYSPAVNVVREVIEAGELGEIQFISSRRVNLGIHQPDVNVVWDLGAHDFSILRHWLGEVPQRVAAVSRSCVTPGIADVAFLSLEFPSGVLANVELAWLAPEKIRRTVIVGSRKMVVYDDMSAEPVRIFDSGVMPLDPDSPDARPEYRTGAVVAPAVDRTEPLLLELQDFCRAVRGGGIPTSSAAVGLDVVRIIEAVDRALGAGVGVEVAL